MTTHVSKAPKGFKKQVFGIVLVIFGAVNVLLNLKTDIEVDAFDLLMIVLGGSLFGFGFVQKYKGRPPASQRD